MSTNPAKLPHEEGSVSRVIRQMKAGDDSGAPFLWDRFFDRIRRAISGRLNSRKSVSDDEDVALQSLTELFGGMLDGKYPDLADRESLWKLLVTVAMRNVVDHINSEQRQKRGGGRVYNESAFEGDDARRLFETLPAEIDTPDVQVMVTECCARLLESLDDAELQTIAIMKTSGFGNAEVAESLGISIRSVERRLSEIRRLWTPASAS